MNYISNCNPNSILRRKSPPKPFPSEYLPRGNLIYQPDCTINIHSGSFLRIPMFYSCETKQGFENVSMFTIVLKAGASIFSRTDKQKCLILFQTQNFLYQNENLASEFTFFHNMTHYHIWCHDSWIMIHNICYAKYYSVHPVLCKCVLPLWWN